MNARRLFLYMLGQLGIMMLARFFFQWILRFADAPAGDSTLFAASTVGAVLLGFRVFDGVTDPLAGAFSDWWVRKGCRRQSLLWFAFPLPALGLLLCFAPLDTMSLSLRWLLLSGGFLLFFIGYTVYAIPYLSLVQDYGYRSADDRRALSNMLGLGLILATIFGFVLSPLIVDAVGYRWSAVCISVLALGCMVCPIFAAPPDLSVGPAVSGTAGVNTEVPPVFRTFAQAFGNKRFIAMLCLLAGSQMSFTVLTAAAPFIAVHLLHGNESGVSLLLGPLIVTSLPMFYYAPRLSARFGWEPALFGASLLLGGVYCCAALIGIPIVYSPMVTAMLIFGAGGPMIAVLLALEGEAIAACSESSGAAAVSVYFGVYNLVVKIMNGAALFVTGLLVTASRGSWGAGAIRGMVIGAGIMLFVGVLASMAIKRSAAGDAAELRQSS